MPGGDRTGPAGMGPMTGRAAGYCAGNAVPGFVNTVPGRGLFGGRGGRGRGRRNWFHATGLTGWQRAAAGMPAFGGVGAYGVPYVAPFAPAVTNPEQEIDLLKRQAEYFANALEGIKKRLEELEAQPQEQ